MSFKQAFDDSRARARALRLRVTQTRSSNGINPKVKAVIKGLGLGRIGRTIVVDNTPSFRGMIKKVLHLVTVQEVES